MTQDEARARVERLAAYYSQSVSGSLDAAALRLLLSASRNEEKALGDIATIPDSVAGERTPSSRLIEAVERMVARLDKEPGNQVSVAAWQHLLSECKPAGERTCGTCAWTEDEDEGKWDTACGHAYCFIADGPRENGTVYCQYCGGKVELGPAPTGE